MIALWVVNGLLGATFLVTGSRLAVLPKTALAKSGAHWVADVSVVTVKVLGTAQILGAAGLVLPLATRIAPVLAPIAAACLLLIMIGATTMHIRRDENPVLAITVGVVTVVSVVLGLVFVGPQ